MNLLENVSNFLWEDGLVNLKLDKARGNIQKLSRALVGGLLGRRVHFWVVQNELQRKQGHLGLTRIPPLGADFFLYWFENVEARNGVLISGPWHVEGQIIGVEQWSAGSSSKLTMKFTSPVWIRLPNLPLEYWAEANLARLAAGVGEPLFMDEQTKMWHRCAFVRICVKLDLSKRLPKSVWAQGLGGTFFQSIEYEGIAFICLACGKVSHKAEGCSEPSQQVVENHSLRGTAKLSCLGQGEAMVVEQAVKGNTTPRAGSANMGSSSIDSEHGEWTIVSRRWRSTPASRRSIPPAGWAAGLPRTKLDGRLIFKNKRGRIRPRLCYLALMIG